MLVTRLCFIKFSEINFSSANCDLMSSAGPFKRLCSKRCGPTSDRSSRSSLIWVYIVCLYIKISHWRKHLHSVVDFSRRNFRMKFVIAGEVLNFF